jgi:uncharacterized protein DUF1918
VKVDYRRCSVDAHIGDRILIESRKVGGGRKSGEVVEVIQGAGGQHYRIRWDDDHESIVYPSSDATVVSAPGHG